MNSFALQQIHYVTEHSHDHSVPTHEGHEHCGGDLDFHAYHFDVDCSICDFNFSPRESVETNQFISFASLFFTNVFATNTEVSLKNEDALYFLRGPPIHFI